MRRVGRILAAIAATGFGYLAFLYLTVPDVRELRTRNPGTTAFMALRAREARAEGHEVRRVHAPVPYRRISPHLRRAVLVAEDARFWGHEGVDLEELQRSLEADWERGTLTRGASTITQQLAKNLYLSPSRNPARKLTELFITRRLEHELSKTRIFELYLNNIEWGEGIWGAEAAARTYFKTSAGELTTGQAAYLAGVIRSPERYQIGSNLEGSVALRNRVLDGMSSGGYIKPEEAEAAKAEDLMAQYKPGMTIEVDSPRAGYFVEYVRRILKRDFGLNDEEILAGGLQIHTTLDLKAQDAAEEAVRTTLDRPDDPEVALVAMDPEGRVRAMVGGRDVDNIDRSRGFNFSADVNATGGGRQAGSAFKPFALAAFLDEGKSLASTFSGASPIRLDSPQCKNADGRPWEVSNFGNSSYGGMDVTAATLASVNTIYAQIMDDVVTPNKFIEIAHRTGIEIPAYDAGCALALGTTDVTPLEMARAYTTFATRGERPDILVVTKIARPDGEVLAEKEPRRERALDTNVADSVNYVLERNVQSGTGTGAKIGRPAAGKTGTTQNFQNAWFAGYTPELTAVVWMGFPPNPDGYIPEMQRVRGRQVTGGSFPATIWRRFMSEALSDTKGTDFHRPKFGGEIAVPKLHVPSAELASSTKPVLVDEDNPGPPPPEEGNRASNLISGSNPPPGPLSGGAPPSKKPDAAENIGKPCFPFCN
jgi:penicillin-binding protein 1A